MSMYSAQNKFRRGVCVICKGMKSGFGETCSEECYHKNRTRKATLSMCNNCDAHITTPNPTGYCDACLKEAHI
jgi:hypothetical protein